MRRSGRASFLWYPRMRRRQKPGAGEAQRRQQTWMCLSALVGALTLARGVADATLAAQIREDTIAALIEALVPAA